jgi:hypothetical protein
MLGSPKERRRAVVTIALAVWTLGPWMPSIACALQQRDATVSNAVQAPPPAEASTPKCHGHASQPQDASQSEPRDGRAASDCCKDVEGNCCLEAASIAGAPSAEKRLDAPDVSFAVFAAPLTGVAVSTATAPAQHVCPCVSPPLSRTSVLRL